MGADQVVIGSNEWEKGVKFADPIEEEKEESWLEVSRSTLPAIYVYSRLKLILESVNPNHLCAPHPQLRFGRNSGRDHGVMRPK